MISPTHFSFSILIVSLSLQTVNPAVLATGGFASLLPDIDHTKSVAGRLLFPISKLISARFSHRTLTHSWIAVLVVAVLSAVVFILVGKENYCLAFFIGYFSGIVGDMMTKSGVNFFYPIKVSVIIFRNPALRFKSGSLSELVLLIALFFASTFAFDLQSEGGLVRVYEQFVGSESAAINFYNQNFNQSIISAKIEGIRSGDRSPINDTFRVVYLDGKVFLLQDSEGYIYRASSSGEAEIILSKIKVFSSYSASVKSSAIEIKDEPVYSTLKKAQLGDENYLFGDLEVEDLEVLNLPLSDKYFWPLKVEGNKLKIYGARVEQLRVLSDRYGSGKLSLVQINH